MTDVNQWKCEITELTPVQIEQMQRLACKIWRLLELDGPGHDIPGMPEEDYDALYDRRNALLRYMRGFMCSVFGHYVEPDQCTLPEHHYCLWCDERFPGLGGFIVFKHESGEQITFPHPKVGPWVDYS